MCLAKDILCKAPLWHPQHKCCRGCPLQTSAFACQKGSLQRISFAKLRFGIPKTGVAKDILISFETFDFACQKGGLQRISFASLGFNSSLFLKKISKKTAETRRAPAQSNHFCHEKRNKKQRFCTKKLGKQFKCALPILLETLFFRLESWNPIQE